MIIHIYSFYSINEERILTLTLNIQLLGNEIGGISDNTIPHRVVCYVREKERNGEYLGYSEYNHIIIPSLSIFLLHQ